MATTACVGILGYQGCIEPHERIFQQLGVRCIRVKTPADLAAIDRIILPGGESTTMLRFMKLYDMVEPLRQFAKHHRVWGICAGAILAAKEVSHPSQESLGLIDIAAHRNFYGSQIDSFSTQLEVDLFPDPVEAHFIRAPLLTPLAISSRTSSTVRVHATHNGQPVFLSQGNTWACSFHVELGTDLSLHRRFLT